MSPPPRQADEHLASQALHDYLDAVDAGRLEDPVEWSERLTDGAREVFLEALDALELARADFPRRERPTQVVAGRYRLRSEIGAGGFGRVWRAEDLHVHRDVAIKFFDARASASRSAEDVFEAERRALARIDAPGIAGILDAGRDRETFYLVMDLVDGRPLDEIIERMRAATPPATAPCVANLVDAIGRPGLDGAIDLTADADYARSAVRIAVEMLRTLESVHATGVLHRDLKPSNVMLVGGGRPVLLDFGIAALRDADGGQASENLSGTPNYFAPEQLESFRGGRDVRTDVYQAGLTLYALLALRPAFDLEQGADVYVAIRKGHFAPLRERAPWVPSELEDVVLTAIELDTERRYPTAGAFREDLERWLDPADAPVASRAGTVGKALRTARYVLRRHRVRAMIGAAAVLGAVLTAAALQLRGTPSVAVTEARLLTDNRIAATLKADEPSQVFAVLSSSGADGTVYYTPLDFADATTGARTPSLRAADAGFTVELARTDDGPIGGDERATGHLRFFATTDPEEEPALLTAWQAMRQIVEQDGQLRRADAWQIFESNGVGARGGDAEAVSISWDRIADRGDWRQGSVSSSSTPLVVPR